MQKYHHLVTPTDVEASAPRWEKRIWAAKLAACWSFCAVASAGYAETIPVRLLEDSVILNLDFEEPLGDIQKSTQPIPLFKSIFLQPDFVPGVVGRAWRSDGFSSSVTVPTSTKPLNGFTVSAWVALESYPSALELPVDRQVPASLFQQMDGKRGFDVFIDTYGRWGSRISTDQGIRELRSTERFPLYRWVHVAVSYDPQTGTLRQYLDGAIVAERVEGRKLAFVPASVPFQIANSWRDAPMQVFNVNGINGAYDNVALFNSSLASVEIAKMAKTATTANISTSLAVPDSRFAQDHLRPRYHAMPPANWTNEPHGLVLANGRYHLFYQRTPNGPYKTQMHWGHMSSSDLVNWTHHRDALRPELQSDNFGFDMKGIWSGDVIIESGKAFAYYTSVNHSGSYNPGISLAVSEDPDLKRWKKLGPIIDIKFVEDFRDPYLWNEDGVWHMIIGAALKNGGGLDYYRCTRRQGPSCWEHGRNFVSVPYAKMEESSVIWEMPVFEKIDERRLLITNPIGGKVTKYGEPATRGLYWLGHWQDGQFNPDTMSGQNLDLVPGHLAPAVARQENGVLAAIGIVDERRSSQSQENAGWAHTFSLPREYYLTGSGRALGQRALPALASLRDGVPIVVSNFDVEGVKLFANKGFQAEVKVQFANTTGEAFGVVLAASPGGEEVTRLIFDPSTSEVVLDKTKSTLSSDMEGPQILRGGYDRAKFGPPTDWHVFIDGSVVDVFIGKGAAFSFRIYPTRKDSTSVGFVAERKTRVAAAEIWKLRPSVTTYDFSE